MKKPKGEETPTPPASMEALDVDEIRKLFQKFGEAVPLVIEMFMILADIYAKKPKTAVEHHPNVHLHDCCKAAMGYQLEAMVEIMHAQECCKP